MTVNDLRGQNCTLKNGTVTCLGQENWANIVPAQPETSKNLGDYVKLSIYLRHSNKQSSPKSPFEKSKSSLKLGFSSSSPLMATETKENGGSKAAATESTVPGAEATPVTAEKKWPGWPGDSVFRVVVPVMKVGSIIGRKGEAIKKMCDETGARIRVLDGIGGTNDRIVLVSGKEEPEAAISPAMHGVLRVFKRINGLADNEGETTAPSAAGNALCSVRLLVASSQAINLIGKQGVLIKSIQESTGASVRVLSSEEVPYYATSEERVVDIQGEALVVLKALEAVVGHLRKFLVDHSVLPMFEKVNTSTTNSVVQERPVEPSWVEKPLNNYVSSVSQSMSDYPGFSMKRESLFLERESHLEPQFQHSAHTGLSLYGQDPSLSGLRPSGFSRPSAPIVTQMTQTMQIPLSFAEDIIGIEGAHIAHIRRTSGAILTVQESRGSPDEITVEIKGTSTQVQTAQQLIQDFIAGHKDPVMSGYGKIDTGLRSYSQMGSMGPMGSQIGGNSSYSSAYMNSYGPSGGLGGYNGYRI